MMARCLTEKILTLYLKVMNKRIFRITVILDAIEGRPKELFSSEENLKNI